MSLGRVFPSDTPDEGDSIGIGYGADIVPIDTEEGDGCEICGKEIIPGTGWAVTPIRDHHTYLVICSECAGKKRDDNE